MFFWFLFTYILGGLTFLPLLVLAIFYHAYKTQPIVDATHTAQQSDAKARLQLSQAQEDDAREHGKKLPAQQTVQPHDGVALFFAVCREYVMGGVDVKLDRANGAGGGSGGGSSNQSSHNESPSVYQSMYRSIFDRSKGHSPSLDAAPQKSKKPRNVFFVVIRLGLLMLYDDEEQVEVRHVISLENYDIDVYGGGEELLDGELWVKRNCIRLIRRHQDAETLTDSKPFYLFSNDCSKKEDFYHGMLIHQSRRQGDHLQPLTFDSDHMMKLFRQLHSTEDHLQTRWINALIGRVFLALYKTSLVEQLVRMKVNKKLSRVVKPTFISAVQIRNISLGDSAPSLTNPKLRELTQEGDLTIEADVRYKGNTRIDVAAVVRIDLGTRFKAREVDVILAVICKSLEGHMLIRVKPPPSNRIWISFEGTPKLDLSIEPIISSRQITYSLILRAIESRIREVVNETLVFPNWDDIPFFDTLGHEVRGGIWHEDSADAVNSKQTAAPTLVEGGEGVPMQDQDDPVEAAKAIPAASSTETLRKNVTETPARQRRKKKSPTKKEGNDTSAITSSADHVAAYPPRAMRSQSFASAAIPIVTNDAASTPSTFELSRSADSDAAANLTRISSRSHPGTPTESPIGSPQQAGLWKRKAGSGSMTSRQSGSDVEPIILAESADSDSINDVDSAKTLVDEPEPFTIQKRQTIASTAAAARKWGLGLIAKSHSPSNSISGHGLAAEEDSDSKPVSQTAKIGAIKAMKESLEAGTSSIAYGRGKPLPPIGTPLPGPGNNRKTWTAPLSLLGRKKNGADLGFTPQPSPNAPSLESLSDPAESPSIHDSNTEGEQPPKLPPRAHDEAKTGSLEDLSKGSNIPRAIRSRQSSRRQRLSDAHAADHKNGSDSILIIAAPDGDTDHDSESLSSPSSDGPQSDHRSVPHIDTALQGHVSKIAEGDSSHANSRTLHTSQNGSQPQSTTNTPKVKAHRIARKPISGKASTSSLSLSESADWAADMTQPESAVSSPSKSSLHSAHALETSTSSDAAITDTAMNIRKTRSRQSLIPTPTSSRKSSPIIEGAPARQLANGRRTSTQSLHDLTRTESRRSNGIV